MDLQERQTNYSKLLTVYRVCVSICITVFIYASVYLCIDRQTRIRAKKYTEDWNVSSSRPCWGPQRCSKKGVVGVTSKMTLKFLMTIVFFSPTSWPRNTWPGQRRRGISRRSHTTMYVYSCCYMFVLILAINTRDEQERYLLVLERHDMKLRDI